MRGGLPVPNRIIKESICTSDTLDKLTAEEERLFYRLLVQADDFGRFDGRAAVVLAGCFPLRAHEIGVDQVEAWLQKLVDVDLIRFYWVDGRRYLYFTTWNKHQQKRAKYSKFPDPPTGACEPQPHDAHLISSDIKRDTSDIKCPRETRIREYENREARQTDETSAREGMQSPEHTTPHETADNDQSVGQSVSPPVDNPFSQVTAAYHAHIGAMGPSQFEVLRYWHDDMGMPPDVMVEAILEAKEQGKNRIGYIEGILRNWHNDGVRTVEQARGLRQPRERPKSRSEPVFLTALDKAMQMAQAKEASEA